MKEVKQPDRKRIFYFYAIAIALLFLANLLLPSLIAPKTQTVTYDEFVDMAESGQGRRGRDPEQRQHAGIYRQRQTGGRQRAKTGL